MAPEFAKAFKINGVNIPFPEEGQWVDRRKLGRDGNNRAVYSPVRSFRLQWSALTPAEHKQIHDAWKLIQSSGSASVTLPDYPGVIGTGADPTKDDFTTYTGAVFDEPTVGPFLQGQFTRVEMIISNLVTT